MALSEEWSGITIVILIALGVLIFILLFILGKRQIMRFTLKSRSSPHTPVGHNAPKGLKREIERRLDRIGYITYEPNLLANNSIDKSMPYYYRMLAMDDLDQLKRELMKINADVPHLLGENLEVCLISLLSGPLRKVGQKSVEDLCDSYAHARYDPDPFCKPQYQLYQTQLNDILNALNEGYKNSKNIMISPISSKLKDRLEGSEDSAIEQDHSASSTQEDLVNSVRERSNIGSKLNLAKSIDSDSYETSV